MRPIFDTDAGIAVFRDESESPLVGLTLEEVTVDRRRL